MMVELEAKNLPPFGADSWVAIFSRIQPNIFFPQQASELISKISKLDTFQIWLVHKRIIFYIHNICLIFL